MLGFSKKQNKVTPILLTGIQPSGKLTLGNYIGSIRQAVKFQENYQCYFLIVDLHTITVKQDPKDLYEHTYDLLAMYIAAGLDPEKCTIFAQSHVSAHTELAWILNCSAGMGELSRMTQFKDKSQKNEQNINVGLFAYPVLMAADILLYSPELVPVGADQKQHLELSRDLAERFNKQYDEVFVVPDPYIPEAGARIMSLQDPESKMSKSDENENAYIALLDTPEVVEKKIKKSVTDSEGVVAFDKKRSGISNLVTIYSTLAKKPIDEVTEMYVGKGYGDFKKDLTEVINQFLKPIQDKYYTIRKNKKYLNKVLYKGAEKAAKVADEKLREVYKQVGFVPKK